MVEYQLKKIVGGEFQGPDSTEWSRGEVEQCLNILSKDGWEVHTFDLKSHIGSILLEKWGDHSEDEDETELVEKPFKDSQFSILLVLLVLQMIATLSLLIH